MIRLKMVTFVVYYITVFGQGDGIAARRSVRRSCKLPRSGMTRGLQCNGLTIDTCMGLRKVPFLELGAMLATLLHMVRDFPSATRNSLNHPWTISSEHRDNCGPNLSNARSLGAGSYLSPQ